MTDGESRPGELEVAKTFGAHLFVRGCHKPTKPADKASANEEGYPLAIALLWAPSDVCRTGARCCLCARKITLLPAAPPLLLLGLLHSLASQTEGKVCRWPECTESTPQNRRESSICIGLLWFVLFPNQKLTCSTYAGGNNVK